MYTFFSTQYCPRILKTDRLAVIPYMSSGIALQPLLNMELVQKKSQNQTILKNKKNKASPPPKKKEGNQQPNVGLGQFLKLTFF